MSDPKCPSCGQEKCDPWGCTRDKGLFEPKARTYTRVVVCAAIRIGDFHACGARHHDMVMNEQLEGHKKLLSSLAFFFLEEEQGFIDQHGVFMTREEAWKVASEAGQIRYRVGGDGEKLFSENLY